MMGGPRSRFVHYILADNQNREWLEDLTGKAEETVRGIWYGRADSDESIEERPGVRFFSVERGLLVATNHPLWKRKVGRPFKREDVPCR